MINTTYIQPKTQYNNVASSVSTQPKVTPNSDSKYTKSIYKDAGLIHTSWFYVNDVHGKMTRMERIYNICKEFDNTNLQEAFSDFFKQDRSLPRLLPVSKFKVESGDIFIGANEKNNKVASEFLRWCGFDAAIPGNHEFDVPDPENLGRLMSDANTKILAANMKVKDVPSTIIERDGEKYGFIGISPSDIIERVKMNDSLASIEVADVETTIKIVQDEVRKLKEQGINKIILLSHSGLKNDKRIALETDGIDIIFGAHTHELIKGVKEGENLFYSKTGEPIVITQAGKDGNHVGVLNVDFDNNGVIKKVQNNVIDTMIYNRPLQIKDSVEKIIGKPEIVGRIRSAVPTPKNRLIEDNPHGNLIADSMRIELGTDIGLLNAANIRGHFSEGIVDSRLVADITPFEDDMMVLDLTEKQIIDMIKVGLKSFKLNSHKPGIMLVSGMKYTCNKQGELLDAEFIDKDNNVHKIDVNNPSTTKHYTVATDDFIATGGDHYLPTNPNPDYVLKTIFADKNKLACDYMKKFNEPIDIKYDGRITILD